MKSKVLAGFMFCGTPVNVNALRKLMDHRPAGLPHPSSHLTLPFQVQSLFAFPTDCCLFSRTLPERQISWVRMPKSGGSLCFLKPGSKIYTLVMVLNHATYENPEIMIDLL